VNQEFNKILAGYQDSLIGNKKCTFEFKELPIDIFGRVTDVQVRFQLFRIFVPSSYYYIDIRVDFNFFIFPYKNLYFFSFKIKIGSEFDSTILDEQNQIAINKLCEFLLAKKWKLQYRATRDGFSAHNFHIKCDGHANTLTIIKSEHGNIFGGFTEKAWDSSDKYYLDPKAFIFSLVNKENKSFKVLCSNGAVAIGCSPKHGPRFGGQSGRHDISIDSDSNANQNSWCTFGSSYKHADYPEGTEKTEAILAGSYNFKILEIEVFTLTN